MLNKLGQYENTPEPAEHFSPEFFKQSCNYAHIGPLKFLPMMEKPPGSRVRYSGPGKLLEQPWLASSLRKFAVGRSPDPRVVILAVDDAYQSSYERRTWDDESLVPEPEWIEQLDPGTRSRLRWNRAIFEDLFDPLIAGPVFNKIFGFACAVDQKAENGLLRGLEDGLWLWRLRRIRQLAWLTVPAGPGELQDNFPHDRYFHSCNVLAVASLIGRNTGLSEEELRTLQIAAYTHDVLTPAGGDRTKSIDWKMFDEDTHYGDAFKLYPERRSPTFSVVTDWKKTEKQLPDRHILTEAVQGQGLLGEILDVADKISYVGSDAAAYIGGSIRFPTCLEDPDYQEVEKMVQEAARSGSSVCAPWADVKREGNNIYFSSPDALAQFLRLRALMFKNLYYNPRSRNAEHVLASVTGRALYQNGTLTRENFLTMTDDDLLAILRNNLWSSKKGGSHLLGFLKIYPEIARCTSAEEAQLRFAELQKDNLVLVERFSGATSTGENLLVKLGGNIKPFKDACPEETEELRELFRSREGYVLYSIPFSRLDVSPEVGAILRETQKTQDIK